MRLLSDFYSIAVGDLAVFVRPFVQQGNRIIAKSLDNRIGCSVLIAHHSTRDDFMDTVNEFDIPYQLVVCDQDGTDAAVMQVACDGAPVGNVSIPCRHIHSPSEIVDLTDVDCTINLLL